MSVSEHFSTLNKIRNNNIFDDELLADCENGRPYGAISDDEKEVLDQLINNLAVDNIFSFIANAYEDIELGKKAKGIHLLDTFEFFLSTPERKEKTYHIYDEKRCKTTWLNPFGWVFKYLKEQSINSYMYFLPIHHGNDDLLPHLKSFSNNTGIAYETLENFVSAEDWEGFVKIVLEKEYV